MRLHNLRRRRIAILTVIVFALVGGGSAILVSHLHKPDCKVGLAYSGTQRVYFKSCSDGTITTYRPP